MKMSFMLLARHKYLLCILALVITSSYFDASVLARDNNNRDSKEVKVGLVANLNEQWGKMDHSFVEMAISDFYKKHDNYTTRLTLQVRHCPNNDVITSAAIVPPAPRTDGFAFAFPKGSPLVSDISQAVLNITEGETISVLTRKWLNKSEDCSLDPSASPVTSSSTLDLDSFVALFAITGGACFIAIVLKFSFFIYENRGLLRGHAGMSMKKRLIQLNRSFHAKKASMSRVSPEVVESSRGSTPPRNSVSDVIDDAGATLPVSSANPPSSSLR